MIEQDTIKLLRECDAGVKMGISSIEDVLDHVQADKLRKRLSEYAAEQDIQFIEIQLQKRDCWVGKAIKDLGLPRDTVIAMIRRGREQLVPRGDVVLKDNDILVLGAAALKDDKHIDLKEIVLRKQNPWNGRLIAELDISRQTIIVLIKRNGTMLIPKGDLMLLEGDHVILYSQTYLADAEQLIC